LGSSSEERECERDERREEDEVCECAEVKCGDAVPEVMQEQKRQ
jgi:hypothetical protein